HPQRGPHRIDGGRETNAGRRRLDDDVFGRAFSAAELAREVAKGIHRNPEAEREKAAHGAEDLFRMLLQIGAGVAKHDLPGRPAHVGVLVYHGDGSPTHARVSEAECALAEWSRSASRTRRGGLPPALACRSSTAA